MVSDNKKTKADTASKDKTASTVKSAAADAAPKSDGGEKVKSGAADDAAKPAGGETAAKAPANYSRGEGQKPVTAAYKENWNAIFAKKNAKKKKR
jgi:hypothetical protein